MARAQRLDPGVSRQHTKEQELEQRNFGKETMFNGTC